MGGLAGEGKGWGRRARAPMAEGRCLPSLPACLCTACLQPASSRVCGRSPLTATHCPHPSLAGCTIVGVEIIEGAHPVHAFPFSGHTAFMLGNEVRLTLRWVGPKGRPQDLMAPSEG